MTHTIQLQYYAHRSVHSTIRTVQFTVRRRIEFNAQSDAQCSVHSTMQTVTYTLRRAHFSTLYDAHSSVHSLTYAVQYIVRHKQCSTQCDAHSSVHRRCRHMCLRVYVFVFACLCISRVVGVNLTYVKT